MQRELIFVGGCPRSGTTALTRLLNAHRDVLIGNERYYLRLKDGALTPEHFDRERFLAIEEGDTHPNDPGLVFGDKPHWLGMDADEKWEEARLIGDKHPPLWRSYALLAERFASAHILYLIRNPFSVAESYQARFDDEADHWPFDAARGVRDWNESVAATLAAAAKLRLTVVTYEAVLRSAEAVGALLGRLGLSAERFARPVTGLLAEANALAGKTVPRNEDIRQHVCLNADLQSYRQLVRQHAIC